MASEKRITILRRAEKYFRQNKSEAAVKEYQKILEIKPDDLEVRRIVGDLELKQNKVREAIVQFEWIADYYLKEGFFAKAIAMYKRITRIDSDCEAVNIKLAELYSKQGLVIEAKQIYLDMAEDYKRKNNNKKSLDMYKKILEFDRNNVKMRLLLASNYLREGLTENAVTEYLRASDILMAKKEFGKIEELLTDVFKKVNHIRLYEKLIQCYSVQGDDQKAIDLLQSMGDELDSNISLLKMLGELYFRNEKFDEAEKVYVRITEINPEEIEVIMKLGKVYLQRDEFDKTYELFLPVVSKNVSNNKFEEATSLLRFIIASNNSYLPALLKLAEIFKISNKKNNLIALYESLLPVYERDNKIEELKATLEELIQLSDSPFTYQEQLSSLNEEKRDEESSYSDSSVDSREISEDQVMREREFIQFNLNIANEAIKQQDFNRALDVLRKSKSAFPGNVEIREKILDILEMEGNGEAFIGEGMQLQDIYTQKGEKSSVQTLNVRMAAFRPDDERFEQSSVQEKTSIDIDFSDHDLEEQIYELESNSEDSQEISASEKAGSDVLLLSEQETIHPVRKGEESGEELEKKLKKELSELDFYLTNEMIDGASELLKRLLQEFPNNVEVIERKMKYESISSSQLSDADLSQNSDFDLALESTSLEEESGVADASEITFDLEDNFQIENNLEIENTGVESSGTTGQVESDEFLLENSEVSDPGISDEHSFEVSDIQEPDIVSEEVEREPVEVHEPEVSFEDISNEYSASDINLSMDIPDLEPVEDISEIAEPESIEQEQGVQVTDEPGSEGFGDLDVIDFDIELESDEAGESGMTGEIEVEDMAEPPADESLQEFEVEENPVNKEESALNLDNIIDDSLFDSQAPFGQADDFSDDDAFDSDELLGEDNLILEDPFYDMGKLVSVELNCISRWLSELERQRTSTIEKNMMEIFEEFKKGVDEKIGTEDYDTRYNLGIAYKEMGLIDEAIHEFLIASKHPLKRFDSCGLLGMCFREKGTYDDAVSWFNRALEIKDRKRDEFLAIKYELVLTYKLQGDYSKALSVLEDIINQKSDFRNSLELKGEIEALMK